MEKLHKDVLGIKEKLLSVGITDYRLVFMPEVPINGIHEFMIEEHFGIKVARLISPSED